MRAVRRIEPPGNPQAPLQIGSAENAMNHPGRRFRGSIDDVRIYKRALEEDEILALSDSLDCNPGM
ncbi:MAG: hypothetical protein GF355_07515 [Candidatus Eisenbacteria bacterium]|nr:hypothetical protein [Candidatus Eisenbacteria bacterium]